MKIRTVAAFIGMVVSTIGMAQTSTPKPTGSTEHGQGQDRLLTQVRGNIADQRFGDHSVFSGKHRNRNHDAALPGARLRYK